MNYGTSGLGKEAGGELFRERVRGRFHYYKTSWMANQAQEVDAEDEQTKNNNRELPFSVTIEDIHIANRSKCQIMATYIPRHQRR